LQYQKRIQENFNQLIRLVIENKLDAFFIIGNLFGIPSPKNQSIDIVARNLKILAENKIKTFIMPGPYDSPLFHSNDVLIHHAFSVIPGIKIISPKDIWKKNNQIIRKPTIIGDINGKEIEIFTPSSHLIQPDDLKLDFTADTKKFSIFSFYGRFTDQNNLESFKDKILRFNFDFLKRIEDTKIDLLLIGGTNLELEDRIPRNLSYNLLFCPPISLYDFTLQQLEAGLLIDDLEAMGTKRVFVSTGNTEIVQKKIIVTGKKPDWINKTANEIIKNKPNPKHGFLQLRLEGIVPRSTYQLIEIFRLIELGKKNDFYFELVDDIQFEEETSDISGLHPLKFIRERVQKDIESLKIKLEGSEIEGDIINFKDKIALLQNAYKRIEEDWRHLNE